MTTSYDDYVTLQPGMDVFASDGDKVGTIAVVADDAITVEKGFFFPKDYVIPATAIEGVDQNNNVHLRTTKDAALNEQWDGDWGTDTGYATGTATDSMMTDRDVTDVDRDLTATSTAESTRVPVYEEELTPVKRAVSRGAVRIQKEVVTEERTVTVPVTEERVRITHVDTDVPVTGEVTDAFEEGYIEVPLTGEEVSLEKTARQTGEVVVDKEAVQREESVGGTVRREEVHVDEDTLVDDVNAMNRRNNH